MSNPWKTNHAKINQKKQVETRFIFHKEMNKLNLHTNKHIGIHIQGYKYKYRENMKLIALPLVVIRNSETRRQEA